MFDNPVIRNRIGELIAKAAKEAGLQMLGRRPDHVGGGLTIGYWALLNKANKAQIAKNRVGNFIQTRLGQPTYPERRSRALRGFN